MLARTLLRIMTLAGVELIRPGTCADLAAMIDAPAFAAAPVSDRISVTVVGRGPDVILVPGLASSAHVWDATVAHLKATHRVHVVQVAGFAGTPAGANASGPVLEPVVAALHDYIVAHRLKAAATVGHSLGGLILMRLAITHPGDVGRLMIVDTLPWYGMLYGPQATVAAVEPQGAAMRDRMIGGTQEAYAAGEPAVMARLIKSRNAEADAAGAAAAASDRRVVGQALYDDLTTDVRSDLPKIAVPVTMLYPFDPSTGVSQGRCDALYTGAYAPLKGARLKRIDGSYHFIMIDQPTAFLAEVDTFLR